MKLRKLLALSMALALTVCPMSVSAADPLTQEGSGSSETVEGDVNYVETTVYKVTLPTTSGLTFALDPQGLTSLDDGGTYSADEAGKIVGTGEMTATNESSVAINLKAEFYLVDTDATETLNLLALDKIADIDDSAKAICLTVQRSDQETSPTYTDYAAITGTSTETATEVSVSMNAADYTFAEKSEGGYEYIIDTNGTQSTKEVLKLGGVVAKDYDWSAYTAASDPATLTLNAIFSFEKYEEATATDTYVMTKGADGCATYTFVNVPTGSLTAVSVNGTAKPAIITNGYVTYSNGVLAFDATRTTNVLGSSATVVVTIGGTDYTLTYTS